MNPNLEAKKVLEENNGYDTLLAYAQAAVSAITDKDTRQSLQEYLKSRHPVDSVTFLIAMQPEEMFAGLDLADLDNLDALLLDCSRTGDDLRKFERARIATRTAQAMIKLQQNET